MTIAQYQSILTESAAALAAARAIVEGLSPLRDKSAWIAAEVQLNAIHRATLERNGNAYRQLNREERQQIHSPAPSQ